MSCGDRSRRRKPSVASIVTFLTLALSMYDEQRGEYSQQSVSGRLHHTYSFASAASTPQNDVPDSDLPRPINYYELLDLESPDMHRRPRTQALHNRKKRSSYRARITNDQVKKAYRKQAQLYHPDKLAARRLKQEKRNATDGNVTIDIENDPLANMTIEEATARFAKIAEAYQVLSDPAQRYDYDWELLEMEDEYEEERLLIKQQQQANKRERQNHDMYRKDGVSVPDSFSLYETMRNGAESFTAWKDNLNLDPWAVFEDFFFQDSTLGDEPSGGNDFYNGEQSYRHQRYKQSQTKQMQSPRVSEQTIYRGFDPGYGANVYTVLRREDFINDERDDDGKYYYQILGQDFISGTQVDPYTGFTLREYYSAVTEPYLVEEGRSNKDDTYDDTYDGHSQRRSPRRQRESIHRLEPGESITPNRSNTANQWISPNGRYEAVLSPTCELQIIRHDKTDNGPTSAIVWSTETYVPHSRAQGCNLALDTLGQLLLSVDYGSGLGSSTASNTVLWCSNMPAVVPHLFHEGNGEESILFHYYASLDNDGVIGVYRVQTKDLNQRSSKGKMRSAKPKPGTDANEKAVRTGQPKRHMPEIVERLSLMYHRLSQASIEQRKTKAALAWNFLAFNVGRMLTARPSVAGDDSNHLSPRSNESEDIPVEGSSNRAECVYSTSPVGCLTPGRNVIYLSRTFATKVKDSLKSLDSKLDDFLSHLSEPADEYESFMYEDDEDDDLLDTLLRVTGAAGAKGFQLGKAGVQAAHIGLKHSRRAAGRVVGKMKEKVGKQSAKWSERMTEKDEFF